jgi:hypothetical protein
LGFGDGVKGLERHLEAAEIRSARQAILVPGTAFPNCSSKQTRAEPQSLRRTSLRRI